MLHVKRKERELKDNQDNMEMTLNDIIRQQGEPAYFTPIEVLACTIDEQAAIANPPFENDKSYTDEDK